MNCSEDEDSKLANMDVNIANFQFSKALQTFHEEVNASDTFVGRQGYTPNFSGEREKR